MVNALHHVALAVRDPQQAATFFHSAMGFEAADMPLETGGSRFLRAPNCYLQLIPAQGGDALPVHARPVNEPGITHFCVQSRKLDVLHASFERAGAKFHSEPVGLGTGNLYCYARDPEANVIEIEGIPYVPEDQVPWLAHVALATPDVGRLAEFYARVVNGTRLGGQKIGPNPLYDRITGLRDVEVIPYWVASLNVLIELWQFLHPPTEAPTVPRPPGAAGYTHLCFEVDDVAAEVANFRSAGARFESSEMREEPGYRMASGCDPDGNAIELLEWRIAGAPSALALPDHDIVARMAELRRQRELK